MPLFQIQDSDRPAFVLAKDYNQALGRWQHAIAIENDGETGEPPVGIAYICDDSDLILGDEGFSVADKPPMPASAGQVAYEAYRIHSKGVSLISGARLPGWDEQASDVKAAWEAAAMAVLATH